MSLLDACAPHSVDTAQLTTASVSPSKRKHPVLKRLERLMDSAGEETDADSESLELALLDVELTKYAAHEGIHIPAASPSTSAGGSSLAQQLSTNVVNSKSHQHSKSKAMQPGTVLQLVQQQSKFLDVLQSMIDKNVGTDKPQQHSKSHSSSTAAVQAAAASEAGTAGGCAGAEGTVGPAAACSETDPQLGMLQIQYERQVADNHALKKRCLKVQKAMLKHMQAARAQAAAAEVAAEEARRREQQAAAANAALQAQLTQQQHMLETQQQQLTGMQEQLLQLKDIHKKKLTRYKVQLQQQYEAQLAAATTAYTQELSMVHAVQLSGGGFNSSAGGASACSDGHPTPRQITKKPRPSSSSGAASGGAVPASVLANTPSGGGAAATPAATPAAAVAMPAATASSATKKSPPGHAARSGTSGRSSGGAGSGKAASSPPAPTAPGAPTAAAAAAAVPTGATGGGASVGGAAAGKAGVTKAQGLSPPSSRRQSQAEEVAAATAATVAAAVNAAASQVDVEGLVRAGARLHRPSLPLEGELSGQLLQQLSLGGSLPDLHVGSTQQALHGQAVQAGQAAAQAAGKQRKQQVTSGGGQRPETPRRATVHGSGQRAVLQQGAGEGRAARAKTTPPALGMDGSAAAAAAAGGGKVAEMAAAWESGSVQGAGGNPALTAHSQAAAPATEASGASLQYGGVPPAVDSNVAVAVAQQLQSHLLLLLAQQLAEHLPPELTDIDPNAIISLQQAVAGHVDQQQQQEGEEEVFVDAGEGEGEGQFGAGDQQQQQQMRQAGGRGEADVPEEVLQYAQQYQQGGEGCCRPPTATPSVLQHQRQQQQVPDAAAQLAQHFVAGGEGTSRPLTAPSSDRSRAMQQHQQHGQSSNSQPGRGGRQAGARNEHPSAVPSMVAAGN